MNVNIYYNKSVNYRDMSELIVDYANKMLAVLVALGFVAYKETFVLLIGVDK